MKKIGKIIGGICLGALAAGMIPYAFTRDPETGSFEVRSLLWGVKVTPDNGKKRCTVTIPAGGMKENEEAEAPEDEPEDELEEEPEEEPEEELVLEDVSTPEANEEA